MRKRSPSPKNIQKKKNTPSKSNACARFEDKRSDSIRQRKQQEMMNNSPLLQRNVLPIQRAIPSKITRSVNTKMDGVTELDAVVGPSHLWARGTVPQPGQPTRIKQVGSPIKGRYVGGHMFNQNYGGPGTFDNMIVLSSDANKRHNGPDSIIKNLAATASFLDRWPNMKSKNGNGLVYEYGVVEKIRVDPAKPDGTANFPGERFLPEGFTVHIRPIRRRVKGGPVEDWPEMKAHKGSHYVKNVPPYPGSLSSGVAPQNSKRRRLNQIRRAIAKKRRQLRGSNVFTLTTNDLTAIPRIGAIKAGQLHWALNTFHQQPLALYYAIVNKTPLGKQLTSKGLTSADFGALFHAVKQ